MKVNIKFLTQMNLHFEAGEEIIIDDKKIIEKGISARVEQTEVKLDKRGFVGKIENTIEKII